MEVTIRVSNAADPRQVGILRDLSLTGVGVRALFETRRGEVKTLVIKANHLFPVEIFSFDAVCRWIKRRRSVGIMDAGFEITNISEEAKKQLNTIIHMSAMD